MALFSHLAPLSPSARNEYLAARKVPPELRAEVDSLLKFDDEARFITEHVAAAAVNALNAQAHPAPGTVCGPWRLLRPLGEGGMGVVWLAERADGEVEQRVAVKFVRSGADLAGFRADFLEERRILASLSHPGIARLLDAGHTAGGSPYLVMEYVEGRTIDEAARQLDLRELLTVFLQVCDAVSFAHRNLVIHRDLKPSNILIDAEGHPKLLDFGIARILDTADRGQTVVRALTPEYASPEQERGEAHSTATDIYSLGAVLYKLLLGRGPHAR